MSKTGIGVLLLASAVALGLWAALSTHTVAFQTGNNSSPAALQGDWVVTEHAIDGVVDTEFASANLAIGSSADATIIDGNGSTQTLQFQNTEPDEAGAYQLLVTTSDDSEGMGGAGGARKAIARIDESGDLEIVEACSADDDYPADFSQATKDVSISWKLSPQSL